MNHMRNLPKKQKKAIIIAASACVLLIIAVVVLLMIFRPKPTESWLVLDDRTESGAVASVPSLQEQVQAQTDSSQFQIRFSSEITIKDKTAKINIRNVKGNPYNTRVELIDSTDTVLFTSDILEPGDVLEEVELTMEPEPGQQIITARFYALDVKTGKELGIVDYEVKADFIK